MNSLFSGKIFGGFGGNCSYSRRWVALNYKQAAVEDVAFMLRSGSMKENNNEFFTADVV